MNIVLYQVDAFTNKIFGGNPAAICPLTDWLDDALLQSIANENNLSETAYIVPEESGFRIRWFTPTTEVDLCGHATLAAAYVLFNELDYDGDTIEFFSRSGLLTVKKAGDYLCMDFPCQTAALSKEPKQLSAALGKKPETAFFDGSDYMAVFESESDIANLSPNLTLLSTIECRGIMATAVGDEVDFVSRFFAPRYGINEDPATGSAHCTLTPYWAQQLGKNKLAAKQLSPRGADFICELKNDRVMLSGQAQLYMVGEILLP